MEPTDKDIIGFITEQIDDPFGYRGLTKREYFAAMAMQGLLSGKWPLNIPGETVSERCAINAVSFADALIEELNKDKL